jgi:hypothetical protein
VKAAALTSLIVVAAPLALAAARPRALSRPRPRSCSGSLKSPGTITAQQPLGVVIHDTQIGGSISETGGGGGPSCAYRGAFRELQTPVYSDYEDGTVGGSVSISKLNSCWLGIARLRIHGDLSLTQDTLSDPDAIEILSNHVGGNLSCSRNSRVWDSEDLGPDLYPRGRRANTVAGKRTGQCVLASPPAAGAAAGPGRF